MRGAGYSVFGGAIVRGVLTGAIGGAVSIVVVICKGLYLKCFALAVGAVIYRL